MRMRMVASERKERKRRRNFGAFSFYTTRVPWRSVAEAAVHLRALDVDAHVVVDGTLGRDLVQIERLLNAVESPREFLAASDDLHDLAVLHVDILGARGDDDRAIGEGSLRRFAVEIAESQRSGRKARGGERQCCQRSEERRVGKECRSRWSPYH